MEALRLQVASLQSLQPQYLRYQDLATHQLPPLRGKLAGLEDSLHKLQEQVEEVGGGEGEVGEGEGEGGHRGG